MKYSSGNTDQDFIAAAMPSFINEAGEQTQALETLLLELEEQPHNRELLDSLFRCAHTIKGSAGIFGLDAVVEFTHHVETLLDRLREGRLLFTPELSTLLLRCNDQIRLLVASATSEVSDTLAQQNERVKLVIQLCDLTLEPESPDTAASALLTPLEDAPWLISARFGAETFRNGMDPLSIARYLSSMGQVLSMHCVSAPMPALADLDPETCYLGFDMVLQSSVGREELEGAFCFVVDDCVLQIHAPETPQQKLARQHQDAPAEVEPEVVQVLVDQVPKVRESTSAPNTPEEGRYIRVQADRLDAVINLLGELVIAGAGATLMARETRQSALLETNLRINQLIEEIRNGTLGLRMVPVGETFNRFRRVVRDTASSLGKEVHFEIMGGEAELDKSMVEKIADPLMHLVRNSLDHGLEATSERLAAGKPAIGKLTLSAHHETGAIVIRVEDDGRGINHERVLQRAWNRGLLEEGVVPSDDAIHMLIFEPGFSTAEQITSLSGRGVGMDVVRRNIEALRGTLKLTNRVGRGLQIDIRLPLTLAIIDGFLVSVGDFRFVLPLESVVEVIEAGPAHHSNATASRWYCLELRQAVLPVVRLQALYRIESNHAERVSVVVVNAPSGRYGIEVEGLLGQQQTVIKPLGRLFKTLRGVSGSSILGSGEVALILDVVSLGELVSADAATSARVSSASQLTEFHHELE